MIVAGWAAQYRQLIDGQRQIISLKLPGDLIRPLFRIHLPLPCAVAALTELETVDAQPLAEAAAGSACSSLGQAIHVMAHMDRMLLDDQIVRLGRQTACGRFAHLMLELHERLNRVGLVLLHSGFDRLSISRIERGQVGVGHLDGDAPGHIELA